MSSSSIVIDEEPLLLHDEIDDCAVDVDVKQSVVDGDDDSNLNDNVELRRATPIATGKLRYLYFLFAILGHVLWGMYAPLSRFLQRKAKLPPLSMIFLVSFMSFFAMHVYFCSFGKIQFKQLYTNKRLWMMSVIVCLRSITNVYSTRFTRAVFVQLIGLLCPFVVAALTRFWLKDALPPFTIVSVIFSLVGVLLMMSGNLSNGEVFDHLSLYDLLGVCLQLVSVMFLSLFLVLVKRNSDLGREQVLISQFFVVLLVFPPVSLSIGEEWSEWTVLSLSQWAIVFFFGFGVFALGNTFQLGAIAKLGSASLVATFLPVRLVSALLLSMLLLDEHIENVFQAIGALIVFITLAFYLTMQATNQKSLKSLYSAIISIRFSKKPKQSIPLDVIES